MLFICFTLVPQRLTGTYVPYSCMMLFFDLVLCLTACLEDMSLFCVQC